MSEPEPDRKPFKIAAESMEIVRFKALNSKKALTSESPGLCQTNVFTYILTGELY